MPLWDTARGVNPGAVFLSDVDVDAWNLGLIVRYDGTDYHGFQKQPRHTTVQGVLDAVLGTLLGAGHTVGASRTDAGVHAAGQVVVWRGPCPVPLARVAAVLNRRLPPAIQIVQVFRAPQGWDPRRGAVAKQYTYRIWRGPEPPPLDCYRRVAVNADALSWARLVEAAAVFVGEHDFRAFRTEGSSAETTVRTILAARWLPEDSGRIWGFTVIGTGFLYRMVRHMVGSMLQAATPGGSLEAIRQGLAHPNTKVGALAPAAGLTLDWIQFAETEG